MNEVKSLLDRVYESFLIERNKNGKPVSGWIPDANDTINRMNNVEFLDLISFELQHMFYDAMKEN